MLKSNKYLLVPSPKPLVSSPKSQTPSLKSPVPYYFILVFTGLLLIMGCVSQPRFRSEPVERKKERIASPEEPQKNEWTQPESEKTNIDQTKMGKIIDSYLGTPYKQGGETKKGMDCSGLAVAVYQQYSGFKLPHDTKKLYKLVKRVDKDDLRYGDLVFFSDGWFGVSHVGIYTKEGKFAHSTDDSGVIVSSLDEDYYKKRYIGARRVIP